MVPIWLLVVGVIGVPEVLVRDVALLIRLVAVLVEVLEALVPAFAGNIFDSL